MTEHDPITELDTRFSSPGAVATPWDEAREQLERAEIWWLSTVRPDERPHVTPLIAVWVEGALYFGTGPAERKVKNLQTNTRCVLTTGCNAMGEALDLVVEGDAVRVTDEPAIRRVAEAFASKYDEPFVFTAGDGVLLGEGGEVVVFEVRPTTAFGFARGETFSHTRWRFQEN